MTEDYQWRDGEWQPASRRRVIEPTLTDYLRRGRELEAHELQELQQSDSYRYGAMGAAVRASVRTSRSKHGGFEAFSSDQTGAYYVPETSVVQERDMPGFRSMDMRRLGEGVLVLDRDGVVWKAITPEGFRQRSWFSLGAVFPADVQLEAGNAVNSSGYADMVPDPYSTSRGVLRIGGDDLASLVQYWYGEPDALGCAGSQAQNLALDFVDELLTQMHRPAKERIGTVQIVKHPSRRGRASNRTVDPLTPWALRSGAQRLLQEVSAATQAERHEADGTYLKRVLDIRGRRDALLQQLAEVDSYLTATEAILVRQAVKA